MTSKIFNSLGITLDKLLLIAITALAIAIFFMPPAYAGGVIKFYDGDNLVIVQGGIKTKVRLACVDAPELKQATGQQSRNALKALMKDSEIQLNIISKDRYGRLIAEVIADGINVNQTLVQLGQAHFDNQHRKGCDGYATLEKQAQAQHLGIWKDGIKNVVLPSQFRQREHF